MPVATAERCASVLVQALSLYVKAYTRISLRLHQLFGYSDHLLCMISVARKWKVSVFLREHVQRLEADVQL